METMIKACREWHDYENKIIDLVVDYYARCELGYECIGLNDVQKKNLLCLFKFSVNEQDKLIDSIHNYYSHKMNLCTDPNVVCQLQIKYDSTIETILMPSSIWLDTIQSKLPYIKKIIPTDILSPIFNQIIKRVNTSSYYKEHGRYVNYIEQFDCMSNIDKIDT